MSIESIWDSDLSPSEWNKIKRKFGPARIEASLTRKVEILEKWAVEGIPGQTDWRQLAGSRTKLRAWHDPSRKLWKWSDDEAEKRPACSSLLERWKNALDKLRTPQPASTKTDIGYLKARISSLELQVILLTADKAWLEEELAEVRMKSASSKKKYRSTSSQRP